MIGKNNLCLMLLFAILAVFLNSTAHATSLSLVSSESEVFTNDIFDVEIRANIDEVDAIIAFGFDLDLSGTGNIGLNGFTVNSPDFDIDSYHQSISDADGILGASEGDFFTGSPVWGDDILLGTFSFVATGVGDVVIGLGADDLDTWYTEGLIGITRGNFMPDVTVANVNVVPEPCTIMLLGTGLVGLAGFRRKTKK